MAAKHGLGRGLSALIRDTPVEPAPATPPGGVARIDAARIRPNPWQPRRAFGKEALDELTASIREHGVLEPLIVRKVEDGYELIAGERRWRAAQQAGLSQVPVVVIEASDQKALELALIENLQRADLNVIEEAEGYQTLAGKFGLTQDEIAQRVNKARASVANALRLLALPEEIKQFISEGLLSAGHAKVLLGLAVDQEKCRTAERVIKEGLSVRDLERVVESARLVPRKRREVREEMPASHVTFLTDKLHQHLGTSVHLEPCRTLVNGRKLKGSIHIDYYSNDDLSRILELLGIESDVICERISGVVMLLGALTLGVSCSRERPSDTAWVLPLDTVNGAAILDEVETFVALGPRVAGTEGARAAATHLKTRLGRLGIEAGVDEFTEVTAYGSNLFRNVIGRIPGGDDLIILAAHYDTKGGIGEGFVGANDSGSGVGVLLAVGQILRDPAVAVRRGKGGTQPAGRIVGPTIWLAFLDGEECRGHYGPDDGLHGSRRLARQVAGAGTKDRIRAVILLDMIGDRDLTVTIPRNGSPELISLAFKAAEEEGVRRQFSLFPGDILDDHQPFLDAGIPAVDLIDFRYGSAPGLNDYWHTEADALDKLSAESLGRVARVTLRMLNALAR